MLMVSSIGLGLGSVFTFKRPDRFCRWTKFSMTVQNGIIAIVCSRSVGARIESGSLPNVHTSHIHRG